MLTFLSDLLQTRGQAIRHGELPTMSVQNYSRKLRHKLCRGAKSQRSRKPRARLRLESLEERTVPTIVFQPHFGAETVSDGGGDVLNDVPIFLIFNGTFWNSSTMGQVENALTAVLDSHYLDGIHQYRSLPGQPTLAGTVVDPNPLADGFGYFDAGLLVPFNSPPPGTLSGNINSLIDNGLLPDADDTPHQPLYLEVTAPGVHSHPNPFDSSVQPGGYHAWFPDLDSWILVPNPFGIPPVIPVPLDGDNIMTAWVGTNVKADGSLDMDQLTSILSHEVLEAITDPGGGLPSIPLLPHGAFTSSGGLQGGIGFNELADGEPNQPNVSSYTYRLPDPTGTTSGILTQAYWSAADQAYIVPDGNSESFFLNPRYDNSGNFLGNYDLTIQGGQTSAGLGDTVSIDTTSAGGITVTLDGQPATFDPGQIHSIDVFLGGGTNTVSIDHTTVGVTVHESGGNDTVNLSPTAQSFSSALQASVNITDADALAAGQPAPLSTTVNAYDQSNSAGDTYTVTPSGMHDQTGSGFTIDHVDTLNLHGGTGNDDYEVQSTSTGSATNLYLGASPTNTVNIQTTSGSLDVYSAVADPAGNMDTINIAAGDPNNNIPGGNLDTVAGLVTVHGNPNVTSVNLLDQNASFNGIYDVSNQAVTRSFRADSNHPWGGLTPFGGLNYSGLKSLTLDNESAQNSVYIASTAAGTTTVINNGSADPNASPSIPSHGVVIGETSAQVRLNGNLDGIAGPVSVNCNDNMDTIVTVDDTANPGTMLSYEVDANKVSRNGTTILNYSGLFDLVLRTSGGFGASNADTIDVEGTSASDVTEIVTAADNTITIGALSHNLDAVGHVQIFAGGGAATLTVDDQGSPNIPGSTTYTIWGYTILREATYVTGVQTTTTLKSQIDYNLPVTLNAGPRRNTIDVIYTVLDTTINAGPAGDTITVFGPGFDPNSLASPPFAGNLTINANGGTLILDDSAMQDSFDQLPDDETFTATWDGASYTVGPDPNDPGQNQVERTTTLTVTHFTPANSGGEGAPPQKPKTTKTYTSYDTKFHYSNAATLEIKGAPLATGTDFTGTKFDVSSSFDVQSTPAGTNVVIDVASPTATVTLGTGDLSSLAGPVTVNRSGAGTAVTLDDHSATGTQTYVLNTSSSNPGDYSLTRANFGGLTFGNVGNLTLDVAPGTALGNYQSSTNVIVLATPAGTTTTINAAMGANNITVGLPTSTTINTTGLPGSPLENIQGPVTINGNFQDILTLWDWDSSTNQKTYAINSNNIAVTVVNGVAVANPVPISWQGNLSVVALYGSAAADTYQLQSPTTSLAALVVNGYYRQNTFQSNLPDKHTWLMYSNQTVTTAFQPGSYAIFGEVWNLTGGPGGDDFQFLPNYGVDGKLDGMLNGNGGTLDYSHYHSDVTVDLPLGYATGVGGGVTNIQDLIGSGGGASILVGNGGNVLTGGNGPNLLIAGAAASTLIGGSANDILIGGTTDFDRNLAALAAIMQEWTQPPPGHDPVSDLLNGTGLLAGTGVALNATTVHSNGGQNTLGGGLAADLDLYFGIMGSDNAPTFNPATDPWVSIN